MTCCGIYTRILTGCSTPEGLEIQAAADTGIPGDDPGMGRIMQRQTALSGWFDAFGELHMAYCSKAGSWRLLGKFFTPVSICELMVQCTRTEKGTTGKLQQ